MTLAGDTRVGTIDWIELTTPDVDAARRFYADLFGWSYTELGDRLLAEIDERKAAGIAPVTTTIGDMGLPATWTMSIRVDDLAASVARVRALGGDVIEPPMEVPEGWRHALVSDPTGAVFALVQATTDFGIDTRAVTGALDMCDLLTRDPVAAVSFYGEFLGWSGAVDADSGYTTFDLPTGQVAGLMPMPDGVPAEAPSYWLPYFRVEHVDVSVATASTLGATVSAPPMDVDSMRFAVLEDPAGAVFAVLEHVDRGPTSDPDDETTPDTETRIRRLVDDLVGSQLVMTNRVGRPVIDVPLAVGAAAALVAPLATASGILAALGARWSIAITSKDTDT